MPRPRAGAWGRRGGARCAARGRAPARAHDDAAAEGGGVGGAAGRALRGGGGVAWAGTAPAASAALAFGAAGGALARAAALARMPRGERSLDGLGPRVDGWGARFDGRLRVCAVDRRRGRRVVFGEPGAPVAGVGEAVVASCSIPWVFAPVTIGGREYVDGGVWSVTNLDAAPAGRESHVLCLDVLSGLDPRGRGMVALRRAFRVAAELETQTLRRRGAHVVGVGPDAPAAAAIGDDLMAPEPRDAVLAAGFAQGAALVH